MISENEIALKRRHPSLFSSLRRSSLKPDVELVPSRRGPVTLIWKAPDGRPRYVHSPVDPAGEAEKVAEAVLRSWIQSSNGSGLPKRALLVGHGAGYLIRALSARVEELWVLVADLPLLAFLCERLDVSDLFMKPSIRWLFGKPSEIQKQLREVLDAVKSGASAEDVCTVLHPPFLEIIPKEFAGLIEVVEQIRQGRNTEDFIEPIAKKNLRQNFQALGSPGVSSLFGLARGRPVAVVGAGPSLDASLSELRNLHAMAYVIAVDTVAEGLAELGISPDLVFSADPREDSKIHFTDPRLLSRSRLVFTPITHPEIVGRFEGRRFLAVPQSHFLLKPIEHLMAGKGILMGGGSVSLIASALAVAMEPAYVCLAGVDLGVEETQEGHEVRFYSRLSSYLRWARDGAHRFSSSELKEYEILTAEIRRTERDPKGGSPRLKSYASEFRYILKECLIPFYSLGPTPVEGVRSGVLPCLSVQPPQRPIPVPPDEADLEVAKTWLEGLGLNP